MKIFFLSFLAGIAGYAATAFLAYFLISKLSSNSHDRGMEASMTSIFVIGPIGFVITFILAFWYLKSKA